MVTLDGLGQNLALEVKQIDKYHPKNTGFFDVVVNTKKTGLKA